MRTPWLSLLLGYGAMLPLVVAAVVAWADGGSRAWMLVLAMLWGCAVLLFLAGVRRGLSFRTAGGPTVAQIATMLWLFALGLAAMVTMLLLHATVPTLALLAVGYASLAVLDPAAAGHGEVPPFFARLRPLQMGIAVVALLALIARSLAG